MELFKANALDAGFDLKAEHGAIISQESVTSVHTGIKADIPQGHVGIIFDRSSMGRNGIKVMGGVIDAGYTGEIIVQLVKLTPSPHVIESGDKIAQLVVLPLSSYVPNATSKRGNKGFGSSGV